MSSCSDCCRPVAIAFANSSSSSSKALLLLLLSALMLSSPKSEPLSSPNKEPSGEPAASSVPFWLFLLPLLSSWVETPLVRGLAALLDEKVELGTCKSSATRGTGSADSGRRSSAEI